MVYLKVGQKNYSQIRKGIISKTQTTPFQKLPDTASTGRHGFCGTLRVKHFLVVELVETLALSFSCSQARIYARTGG